MRRLRLRPRRSPGPPADPRGWPRAASGARRSRRPAGAPRRWPATAAGTRSRPPPRSPIVRRTPLKRSSTSTSNGGPPSRSRPGLTSRSSVRRSIRTPRCWSRTLAGARSPVRDSSLPAMLSWVTRTARLAELLGQRHRDRTADRIEEHDVALLGQAHLASADLGHVEDGCTFSYVVGGLAPHAPRALHDDLPRCRRGRAARRAPRPRRDPPPPRPATPRVGRPVRRRRPSRRGSRGPR